MLGLALVVIASQRVRPEVAGPTTSSAKQSGSRQRLPDCFVASLLAMTAQYFAAIGNSSAGNNEMMVWPLLVTTTSSSMRAAE
jgi:hypothetical protein